MKKLFLAILAVLVMVSICQAGPYLISDPYGPCGDEELTECPVSATIYADGIIVADNIALENDLSIRYDISGLPNEEHVYTATYTDKYGRTSEHSDPCLLLVKPLGPKNMHAVP